MPSIFSELRRANRATRVKVYFLGFLGLVVIGATSWSLFEVLNFIPTPSPFEEREIASIEETEEESPNPIKKEVAAFTYGYDLQNISIPLANRNASQIAYAQFTLRLDCPSADAKRTIAANRAKVLDKVFEVATQFYIEDFKNPQGYGRFKVALNKALGGEFRAHSPRGIAIEDWVMN